MHIVGEYARVVGEYGCANMDGHVEYRCAGRIMSSANNIIGKHSGLEGWKICNGLLVKKELLVLLLQIPTWRKKIVDGKVKGFKCF
jgi:hypothetical protein